MLVINPPAAPAADVIGRGASFLGAVFFLAVFFFLAAITYLC
jgi:hypothetical protein